MLEEGLDKLGINPTGQQLDRLRTYIDELQVWNSRLNLVSVKSRDELIVRHVLDCLSGLEVISRLGGKSIADVGSGAGLPGLLLSIFLEDWSFSLVERSGRKAGFLRSTSAILGLVDRVEVLNSDLNRINKVFDVVTLRAFRNFGDFVKPLMKITADGGNIAAYKGRRAVIEEEIKTAGISTEKTKIINLPVPFLEEERNILLIEKS